MLRNKEIKIYCIITVILIISGTLICYAIYPKAAWMMFLFLTIVFTACLVFTKHRYKQIDQLSVYLRRIANGEFDLDIRDNSEGELSILKNEIYKVTVTLYEQAGLLQKDKLFLSETLSDISHQIKTPITSMSVMADLLSDENLPPNKRMEFTQNIRSQLERLHWLVSSLLKLSKMDAGAVVFKKDLIRVKDLIHKSTEHLLIPMDIKDQRLTIKGDKDASYIGDFNWSCEAVANILKNCTEHTPTAGEICVEYVETPISTIITVTDNGEGISKEDLPRIFDRFYKTSNAGKDSIGIGLAMSKTIVEKQGGSIEVHSDKGYGARFIIKFYKNIV